MRIASILAAGILAKVICGRVVRWPPGEQRLKHFVPSRKIEEQLALLSALRFSSDKASASDLIRKCLAERVGVVVARAANKSAELGLSDLVPDLFNAFDRMFGNPAKSDAAKLDPQCWAKKAIVDALVAFDYREAGPFMRGATYVQMEPVWGTSVDTAPALRGACLLALTACPDICRLDLLRFYIDRLLDPDKTVRREILRGLEQIGGSDCALLLRIKARLGDEEPEVIGQAFESLLRLEPEAGVAFVGEFLERANPEVRDEAALSLGLARSPAGVALLVESWKRSANPTMLRAIGLSRLPEAFEFLIQVIETGPSHDAAAALQALEPHLASEDLRKRVDQAVAKRCEPPE